MIPHDPLNDPSYNKDGWHLSHWFGDKRHFRPWYDDDADYNKDIENEELNEETYVNMIIENLNKDPIMTSNPKLKDGVKKLLPVLKKNSERAFEKYINKTDAIIEKYEMLKQEEMAKLDKNINRIRNIAFNKQGVRQ